MCLGVKISLYMNTQKNCLSELGSNINSKLNRKLKVYLFNRQKAIQTSFFNLFKCKPSIGKKECTSDENFTLVPPWSNALSSRRSASLLQEFMVLTLLYLINVQDGIKSKCARWKVQQKLGILVIQNCIVGTQVVLKYILNQK